jgi:hypothetical protein
MPETSVAFRVNRLSILDRHIGIGDCGCQYQVVNQRLFDQRLVRRTLNLFEAPSRV